MVVVARERTNPQKRAVVLVSRVGVGWCWPEEGPTPKNGRSRSFLGGVGGDGGQRKVQPPKTSGRARFQGGAGKRKAQPSKTSGRAQFRGVWVVVVARGRSNPRK
jgi:hypothetical protein